MGVQSTQVQFRGTGMRGASEGSTTRRRFKVAQPPSFCSPNFAPFAIPGSKRVGKRRGGKRGTDAQQGIENRHETDDAIPMGEKQATEIEMKRGNVPYSSTVISMGDALTPTDIAPQTLASSVHDSQAPALPGTEAHRTGFLSRLGPRSSPRFWR